MKTTEYNVKIPGLNERLRFAVIADLHGHATPELTELALGAMPDAVLMPGDIFDTRGDTPGTLAAIKALAAKKGLDYSEIKVKDYNTYKNEQYDKLADILRKSMDMDKIYKILEEGV